MEGTVSKGTEVELNRSPLSSYGMENKEVGSRYYIFCANCKKLEGEERFKICKRCRQINVSPYAPWFHHYCSKECQKQHWLSCHKVEHLRFEDYERIPQQIININSKFLNFIRVEQVRAGITDWAGLGGPCKEHGEGCPCNYPQYFIGRNGHKNFKNQNPAKIIPIAPGYSAIVMIGANKRTPAQIEGMKKKTQNDLVEKDLYGAFGSMNVMIEDNPHMESDEQQDYCQTTNKKALARYLERTQKIYAPNWNPGDADSATEEERIQASLDRLASYASVEKWLPPKFNEPSSMESQELIDLDDPVELSIKKSQQKDENEKKALKEEPKTVKARNATKEKTAIEEETQQDTKENLSTRPKTEIVYDLDPNSSRTFKNTTDRAKSSKQKRKKTREMAVGDDTSIMDSGITTSTCTTNDDNSYSELKENSGSQSPGAASTLAPKEEYLIAPKNKWETLATVQNKGIPPSKIFPSKEKKPKRKDAATSPTRRIDTSTMTDEWQDDPEKNEDDTKSDEPPQKNEPKMTRSQRRALARSKSSRKESKKLRKKPNSGSIAAADKAASMQKTSTDLALVTNKSVAKKTEVVTCYASNMKMELFAGEDGKRSMKVTRDLSARASVPFTEERMNNFMKEVEERLPPPPPEPEDKPRELTIVSNDKNLSKKWAQATGGPEDGGAKITELDNPDGIQQINFSTPGQPKAIKGRESTRAIKGNDRKMIANTPFNSSESASSDTGTVKPKDALDTLAKALELAITGEIQPDRPEAKKIKDENPPSEYRSNVSVKTGKSISISSSDIPEPNKVTSALGSFLESVIEQEEQAVDAVTSSSKAANESNGNEDEKKNSKQPEDTLKQEAGSTTGHDDLSVEKKNSTKSERPSQSKNDASLKKKTSKKRKIKASHPRSDSTTGHKELGDEKKSDNQQTLKSDSITATSQASNGWKQATAVEQKTDMAKQQHSKGIDGGIPSQLSAKDEPEVASVGKKGPSTVDTNNGPETNAQYPQPSKVAKTTTAETNLSGNNNVVSALQGSEMPGCATDSKTNFKKPPVYGNGNIIKIMGKSLDESNVSVTKELARIYGWYNSAFTIRSKKSVYAIDDSIPSHAELDRQWKSEKFALPSPLISMENYAGLTPEIANQMAHEGITLADYAIYMTRVRQFAKKIKDYEDYLNDLSCFEILKRGHRIPLRGRPTRVFTVKSGCNQNKLVQIIIQKLDTTELELSDMTLVKFWVTRKIPITPGFERVDKQSLSVHKRGFNILLSAEKSMGNSQTGSAIGSRRQSAQSNSSKRPGTIKPIGSNKEVEGHVKQEVNTESLMEGIKEQNANPVPNKGMLKKTEKIDSTVKVQNDPQNDVLPVQVPIIDKPGPKQISTGGKFRVLNSDKEFGDIYSEESLRLVSNQPSLDMSKLLSKTEDETRPLNFDQVKKPSKTQSNLLTSKTEPASQPPLDPNNNPDVGNRTPTTTSQTTVLAESNNGSASQPTEPNSTLTNKPSTAPNATVTTQKAGQGMETSTKSDKKSHSSKHSFTSDTRSFVYGMPVKGGYCEALINPWVDANQRPLVLAPGRFAFFIKIEDGFHVLSFIYALRQQKEVVC